ncbi:hypothetical protein OG555_36110 [Kribbella sp. NBC_01484]|uniref:hypothetical protein n=1 Tax=Kribbella sp. NBC_01484 TaxID=2903579 RepID=UPI002E336CC6|nr:hypothetical protein [Kribbella sp. NBC_01484]
MDSEDLRRRPVVLRTSGDDAEPQRRPVRYLLWAGTSLLGLVAAAGLVAGGTAVWSAFDPGTPGRSPAPLWFPPPENITPQSAKVTPTPDDHAGDRTRTPGPSTATTEPGDDKGGNRTATTKPTSGKSSSGSPTSGTPTSGKSGSGKSGSGESSDDGSSHH